MSNENVNQQNHDLTDEQKELFRQYLFPGGLIIAFEGLDNCFKETNCKGFVNELKAIFPEKEIITEAFPRYGNWACMGVEKWLDGKLDRDVLKHLPTATCALYSLDRLAWWIEKVHGRDSIMFEKYGNPNTCFIFDRYQLSNAFFNPVNRKDTTEVDLNLEFANFGVPKPNIVFWMRANNFDAYVKLLAKKENKDENESDIEFLKAIWERSEAAIKDDIFKKAGIIFIPIDIFDEEGNPKSKKAILDAIWVKYTEFVSNCVVDAINMINEANAKKAEHEKAIATKEGNINESISE